MRERFYSTAELARICGVSISTIKRWTDSGLLRCVRTPGGHRKFRVQDVAEAARRLGTTVAAAETAATAAAELDELALLLMRDDREALVARLAESFEVGDAAGSRRLLLDLHRHGMALGDLAEQVVVGALAALRGTRQADDFVLRRAVRQAETAIGHLTEQLPEPEPDAPAALLATNSNGGETLWPALCALLLREMGWSVVDLGHGVRLQTLQSGLGRALPGLVVLLDPSQGEAELEALRRSAESHGAELLVLHGKHGKALAFQHLRDRAQERERRMTASVV